MVNIGAGFEREMVGGGCGYWTLINLHCRHSRVGGNLSIGRSRDACRGLPGGKSLSFASPKESNQRKGDPMSRRAKARGSHFF
jgi:hypothetical protein